MTHHNGKQQIGLCVCVCDSLLALTIITSPEPYTVIEFIGFHDATAPQIRNKHINY